MRKNSVLKPQAIMKLIIFLFAVINAVAAKALTNEGSCQRSDPSLNICLLNKAESTVQKLAEGIPKYGMEPLQPYLLDFMTSEADMDQFKLKLAMTNISIHGYKNARFHKLKFDPETLIGEMSCTIPVFIWRCDYLATGKLFAIPLESNAHFFGNITDLNLSFNFRFKTVQRKGVEYFSADKVTGKVLFTNFYTKIESIDPARQPQVQLIQDFLNENADLILPVVNPTIDEYTGPFFQHLFERYLRKIPAAELLPK